MSLIRVSSVSKIYRMGTLDVHVLSGIDLDIRRGEYVAVMGSSGSGKSTLLHILGCLDRPTQGSYVLEGVDVSSFSDKELSRIRSLRIGFVFQTFNLLSQLNVYQNIELAFQYMTGELVDSGRVTGAIERVGLHHRMNHRPSELSGGEMQRVAIARAICKDPDILLADEPTGNLDSVTGKEILELFDRLHEKGSTILMVTHDRSVASRAERILLLKDGRFVEEDA